MSTMVEKVAKAIADAFTNGNVQLEDMPEHHRRPHMEAARAAIEAMMEPSKMMVEAGYEKINENIDFWNYESDSGYSVEDIAPSETWRAMIQAALKEEAQ